MTDLLDRLTTACAGTGDDAMITFHAELQPEDQSSKVAPPTYPEGSITSDGRKTQYVLEDRWVDAEKHSTVLLDSVQSQANRVEEALDQARAAGRVDLPVFVVRAHVDGERDVSISSLRAPHRYADAYLQNSMLDGSPLDKTELGRRLQLATPDDVRALYELSPESLIYGAWNSHRKGRQAKFPRIYRSEVVGLDPIVGSRRAGRMDPENLAGQVKPTPDGGWDFASGTEKVKGGKLSERGLGNIAPQEGPGGVTISRAIRLGSLSLAGARRLGFGDAHIDAAVAARTCLVALALFGDRLAFGQPSIWLRSGCDLVVVREAIEFLRRGGDRENVTLDAEEARSLFTQARERASALGVPMGAGPIELQAGKPLAEAIRYAYLRAAAEEAS